MCRDDEFDPERSELVLGPINKPRWIYSCAKQLMDRVIHAYGMQEGLDYTLFRPFNWIGAGLDSINTAKEGSSRVITQFLGHIVRGEPIKLVDGGTQKRAFTYIDDGIAALMKIIANDGGIATGKIYNIGNPANNFSVRELATMMLDLALTYPEYRDTRRAREIVETTAAEYYGAGYQDVQNRVPKIANTCADLDWQPDGADGRGAAAHLRRVPRPGRARRGSLVRLTRRRRLAPATRDAARAQDRRRHAARHARRRAQPRHAAAQARRRRDVPVLARSRPHRARDQARVPARLLRQGAPHVGRPPLRREDAAVRHACCPAPTSAGAPAT